MQRTHQALSRHSNESGKRHEDPKVVVIVPAYNEEQSIQNVIDDIPGDLVTRIIVVDNNSIDHTADRARGAGATVVREPEQGYGSACLKGIEYASNLSPDVVVFIDADYSDHPDEMIKLLEKIKEGYDLVIGSRMIGNAEPGALLPQARFGNLLAVFLIKVLYGYQYTDLGPFRAIRWNKLQELKMQDKNFGWTVEMQVKAARLGLKVTEVPVSYRQRVGVSKITGTLQGTVKAGWKILYTIFKYALKRS